MWKTDNDRFKLSDWANKYERENGRIVTPLREEKRLAREQQKDRAERRSHVDEKRAAAQERAHDSGSQAAHLRELGDAQRKQHENARALLAKRDKAGWRSINDASARKIREASRRHNDECKVVWQKHRRELREDGHLFKRNEKTVRGMTRNAVFAARHQQASGQLGGRSLLTATVKNWFSSAARAKAFEEAGKLSEKKLAERLHFVRDTELRQIKVEREKELRLHREAFAKERAELYGPAKGSRSHQWRDLAEREKAGGRNIRLNADDKIVDIRNRHSDECRAIWAKHYLERHAAERDYKLNEKTRRGVVKNSWEAAKRQQEAGQLGGRSLFGAAIQNFFSSRLRAEAFLQGAELSKSQIKEKLDKALRDEINEIRTERDSALKDHREAFDVERAQMQGKQAAERGKLGKAWQRLYGERSNDRVSGQGRKPYWKTADRTQAQGDRGERLPPLPVAGSGMTPAERKARVQAAQERKAAANQSPAPPRAPARQESAGPISAEQRKQMIEDQRKASFADRLKKVQITKPDRDEQEPERPKPRFWPGPSR